MENMLDVYLDLLNLTFFEAKVAFEGLMDEHVWKRPAEGLLSVGEVSGHIAFWYASRFAGEADESGHPVLEKCRVKSPLIDERFSYYPQTLASAPTEKHFAMAAQQVCDELVRVHEESVSYLKASNPNLDAPSPGWPTWPLRESLKYTVFHVSYHVGQIYSARHLLGEQTPDN